MCGLEPAFLTESHKGIVGVHVQITRVRTHITRNETGRIKRGRIAVFDGGDVAGLDTQFALHIQK